jgi:hypothetical protein
MERQALGLCLVADHLQRRFCLFAAPTEDHEVVCCG